MQVIGSVSPQLLPASARVQTPSASNAGKDDAPASSGSTSQTSSSDGKAAPAGQGGGAQAAGGQQASGGQDENLAVDALKKEVERLQQLLAQEQEQLALAQRRAGKDDSARVEVMLLGAAVNTTAGQLAEANARLIETMLAQGQQKGSLLSVQA